MPQVTKAIAVITTPSSSPIKGHILFQVCRDGRMRITVDLDGVPPGKHGLHIHRTGDLRQGCASLCDHFNPFGEVHGGRKSRHRHVGDLGNIEPDATGHVHKIMYDRLIRLSGKCNVVGRSIVVHADEDDLGQGDDEESLRTGNAGKRIACGVIGLV